MKNQYLNHFLEGAINEKNQVLIKQLAKNLEGADQITMDKVMVMIQDLGLEIPKEEKKSPKISPEYDSNTSTLSVYFNRMSNHDMIDKSTEQVLGKDILTAKEKLLSCFIISPLLLNKLISDITSQLENEKYDILKNQNKLATNKRNLKKALVNLEGLHKSAEKYLPEMNSGKISARKLKNFEKIINKSLAPFDIIKFSSKDLKKYDEILRNSSSEDLGFSKKMHSVQKRTCTKCFNIIASSRDQLTKANLRLAVSNSKKYLNRGLELSDLVQEANIGLMEATDRFDHRLNLKFSTYATWWIKLYLGKAINEQARTIRLPANIIDLKSKIVKATIEYQVSRPGENPPVSYLNKQTGIPVDKIELVLKSDADAISLETPLGHDDDGSATLGDLVEDKSFTSPEDATTNRVLGQSIEAVLAKHLSPVQAEVVRLRFGLTNGMDKGISYTLEDVGEKFNLTRERIRQIEAKALKKLKDNPEFKKLKEHMEY